MRQYTKASRRSGRLDAGRTVREVRAEERAAHLAELDREAEARDEVVNGDWRYGQPVDSARYAGRGRWEVGS